MTQNISCWAVIPAAGASRRMGGDTPKQLLKISGKTILTYVLEVLATEPMIKGVVLVGPEKQLPDDIHHAFPDKPIRVVEGGKERCYSVMNGLLRLAEEIADDNWVLVHDAARPCLRRTDLRRLIETIADHEAGGLLGIPAQDTMKQCSDHQIIRTTVDRSHLWHAQTPQMFKLGVLTHALSSAVERGIEVTDEASAMESAGYHPLMVEGHADNIKITRPDDLALAKYYLQQQGRL
jgi:2-C-methyl-D-erythritol 4-phosphate cytidylyltransferase